VSRYWLKGPNDAEYWETTRDEYVAEERRQGFRNSMGKPDEPATTSFTGADGTRGTTLEPQAEPIPDDGPVRFNGFNPNHFFYDHVGSPVTVEKWAALRKQGTTLRESPVAENTTLKTVYLGFVDPCIAEARLFGTALIVDGVLVQQVEVHDSEVDAFLRHALHVEAIQSGYHCARCKEGLDHID